MFINFSNHPMRRWSSNQLKAAAEFGETAEVPFPVVDADASEAEIAELAEECVARILELNPDAVMCQGEFTLTFAVVRRLQQRGIRCVSACSERNTKEHVDEDGFTKKETVFVFKKFREYA